MLVPEKSRKLRPKSPPKSKPSVKATKPSKVLQTDRPLKANAPEVRSHDLSSASTILNQLVKMEEVNHLLDPRMRPTSRMVYTKGLTMEADSSAAVQGSNTGTDGFASTGG